MTDTPSTNKTESTDKSDWRDKDWASRAAKSAERIEPTKYWAGQSNREQYSTAPHIYEKLKRQEDHETLADLTKEIKKGGISLARKKSGPFRPLQRIINDIAKQAKKHLIPASNGALKLDEPPALLISHVDSGYYEPGNGFAWLVSQKHILINPETAHHFLENPKHYRATMAHEIGHILNGDLKFKNKIANSMKDPSQLSETMADRLGALIDGNPREHARNMESCFDFFGDLSKHNMTSATMRYPSPAKRLRALHKWAEILENEGAADKTTGQITDYKKAFELYTQSKGIAYTVNHFDTLIRGR